MNTSGEAADQIVRFSLEAGEVALKITGEGAKELAVLIYTILKEEKKTTGKAKLETLIRSGRPLTIFSVKESDMKKFEQEAKRYGILYYPIPNSNKGDGMYDIMVKEEDAPRINRLVERFKLASVNEAGSIKTKLETVPEKEHPEKSREDKLIDELLGMPMKKEENAMSNPSLARTEKSHLFEHTSGKQSRTAEGTSKFLQNRLKEKASVREELKEIKSARKQKAVMHKQSNRKQRRKKKER